VRRIEARIGLGSVRQFGEQANSLMPPLAYIRAFVRFQFFVVVP